MATSSRLDAKIPQGPLETKWSKYRSSVPLVNPASKRSLEIIVVGTGLAGASAAATPGGTRLQGQSILFPGFSTPCALNCSPRWNQCC